MTLISLVGLSIYMIGHGFRGMNGLIGSGVMIAGGTLVLIGALV